MSASPISEPTRKQRLNNVFTTAITAPSSDSTQTSDAACSIECVNTGATLTGEFLKDIFYAFLEGGLTQCFKAYEAYTDRQEVIRCALQFLAQYEELDAQQRQGDNNSFTLQMANGEEITLTGTAVELKAAYLKFSAELVTKRELFEQYFPDGYSETVMFQSKSGDAAEDQQEVRFESAKTILDMHHRASAYQLIEYYGASDEQSVEVEVKPKTINPVEISIKYFLDGEINKISAKTQEKILSKIIIFFSNQNKNNQHVLKEMLPLLMAALGNTTGKEAQKLVLEIANSNLVTVDEFPDTKFMGFSFR